MRIGIVINPVSGPLGRREREGSRRLEVARRLAASAGPDIEIVLSRAPGHAGELARAFVDRSADAVIAWGGDGTVNEVAGPLVGTTTALGIVPSGSGDGLARGLGLPLDVPQAFGVALRPDEPARPIDVGYLGERHFLNIAGVGFDAAVGLAFNRRHRRGARGYAAQFFTSVWSYRPTRYSVRLGEAVSEGDRFLVAFANGRQYGNGLVLAADADAEDGWLNAVVVDAGSPLRQIWRARRLVISPRRSTPGVQRTLVRTASVSGDVLVCHVDGETFQTSGMLDVRIEPRALWVKGLTRGSTARAREDSAPSPA